jgi:hypothetical protein
VEKPEYQNGKVFINSAQFFDNVPPVAWDFYIGGYQPAQKWLKDRKGRVLGYEDIVHYQKIIVVLRETGEVQREIDEHIQFTGTNAEKLQQEATEVLEYTKKDVEKMIEK